MLQWLILLPGVVVLGAWLSAALHAFLLLPPVAPPHTALPLLFQGFRFFQAETFRPSGHARQRRLFVSAATFGLGILGMLVLAVVISAVSGPPSE